MARVVITGGAGFLGSHLCDKLLARGDEVVAIDNLITGNVANIEHLFTEPRFTFVMHDVSTFVWVPGQVDMVLHFASPASPIDYLEMPIQTLKVGSLGTHNTLGLAKAKGARYFLASTSEVYGDPHVHPQTEDYWGNVNPVGPRGVYDEAKRFAEAMTMAYHRYHGLDTRIVRIFNTYGPRMRPGDGRVVSNFIVQALEGKPDSKLLLCRRRSPWTPGTARLRRERSGQCREPERVHGSRAGRHRDRRRRIVVGDRHPAPAGGRSDPTSPGHHPSQGTARVEAGDRTPRGRQANGRVLRCPGRRLLNGALVPLRLGEFPIVLVPVDGGA